MKRTKILRVALSTLLLVTLLMNLTSIAYATTDRSKISDILHEKMLCNNDKLPVAIWCTPPDISTTQTQTQVQASALAENAEMMKTIQPTTSNISKLSKDIKHNYRSTVSQQYIQKNTNFVSNYLNKDSIVYISKYSPMIIANLTNNEIMYLSSVEEVNSLDYHENPQFDTTLSVTTDTLSSQLTTLSSQLANYTGAGVNIGIFDGGVPNTEELESLNINVNGINGTYTSAHPYRVTKIIAEIAPDANYYFTGNNPDIVFLGEYIEWLLDQNVDIINASLLYGADGDSNYGNFSKWIDHIAYNHYVLIVNAAGNNSAVVGCPGMAYNVMTVGAINNQYLLSDISGYYTGNTYALKPDICAIGPTYTSYATPRVTATAALLINIDPQLSFSPELIKAILTASVDTTTSHHYLPTQVSAYGTNYRNAGAGLLSTNNALNVEINNQSRCSSLTSSNTFQEYTFAITTQDIGSIVRISMAYTVPVNAFGNHGKYEFDTYPIPNLDLLVYAPNNTVASWTSGTMQNNVEIIEFTPTVPGYYKIKVQTVNGTASSERIYFGIAWSIQ